MSHWRRYAASDLAFSDFVPVRIWVAASGPFAAQVRSSFILRHGGASVSSDIASAGPEARGIYFNDTQPELSTRMTDS